MAICLTVASCGSGESYLVNSNYKFKKPYKKKGIKVRLTTYWASGRGSDKWTRKKQSSTGKMLISGRSAAVDPKIIPYGSKIFIPSANKTVEAVDTGSAVIKRTASKKSNNGEPVVDLFFDHKCQAMNFVKNNPEVTVVFIQ